MDLLELHYRHMGVNLRGADGDVSQHLLDKIIRHQGGHGVAEQVVVGFDGKATGSLSVAH